MTRDVFKQLFLQEHPDKFRWDTADIDSMLDILFNQRRSAVREADLYKGQIAPEFVRWLDRKLRLFATACGRLHIDKWRGDAEKYKHVAESWFRKQEQCADGHISLSSLGVAQRVFFPKAVWECDQEPERWLRDELEWIDTALGCTKEEQADLLRDTIGDLFRPIEPQAHWYTNDVQACARAVYDYRLDGPDHCSQLDPTRLSVLADALEDAGCVESRVIKHLRDTDKTRFRGCWSVDLFLKEGAPFKA